MSATTVYIGTDVAKKTLFFQKLKSFLIRN